MWVITRSRPEIQRPCGGFAARRWSCRPPVRWPGASPAARDRSGQGRGGRGLTSGTGRPRAAGVSAPPSSGRAYAASRQREVGPVRRRVHLEELLEHLTGPLELAGVEVRPPERLEDRALAGLEAVGPLEDDRGLRVVPAFEQRAARAGAARTRSRVSAASRAPRRMRRWSHGRAFAAMRGSQARRAVAPAGYCLAVGREVDRLEARRVGQAGDPAALGDRRPSISLMSPVKSIGVAPLMYEPTAYESTGAPASLKYRIRSGLRPPETVILTWLEAGLVEPRADLVDELGGDPAALRRRVEPDAVQPVAEGVRDPQRLLGLVLERVDEDDPWHVRRARAGRTPRPPRPCRRRSAPANAASSRSGPGRPAARRPVSRRRRSRRRSPRSRGRR